MMHDKTSNPLPEHDPLTIGELISLQQAAEYAGLTKDTLHNYAKRGRLKAKRLGPIWVTTRAAVDEYLASREVKHIPKQRRNPVDN
jgi:excisionase family DNA binding protein